MTRRALLNTVGVLLIVGYGAASLWMMFAWRPPPAEDLLMTIAGSRRPAAPRAFVDPQ